MLNVYDNVFADDYLLDLYKICISLPWSYDNQANQSQYPYNSILSEGTHRFFGKVLYKRHDSDRSFDITPDAIFNVYQYAKENLIKEDVALIEIAANLQVYGQDGTSHRDVYNGKNDKTLLFYPNYKWEYNWGGQLQILDNDEQIVKEYLPLPGRLIYLDSSVLHRALAPSVKNIARVSIAFRLQGSD